MSNMIATLVLFDLSTDPIADTTLWTEIVDASLPRYRQVEGLFMKIMLSDAASNTYGALYVWESEAALSAQTRVRPLGASLHQHTGVAPATRQFNVDAVVEGPASTAHLSTVGPAAQPAGE